MQVYVKENYPQLQCQVWHEEEQHCIVTRKMLSGAQQVIIAGTGTAAISLDITSKGQYQLNVLLQLRSLLFFPLSFLEVFNSYFIIIIMSQV